MLYKKKYNMFDIISNDDEDEKSEEQQRTKISILVACEAELENLPEDFKTFLNESDDVNLIITGVGKINATMAATECILKNRDEPNHIVCNIGTAGSFIYPKGTLGIITKTGERDMDATDIMRAFDPDYPLHLVPFEEQVFQHIEIGQSPIEIPNGNNILYGGTCWTGDNTHGYTEESEVMKGDFIDMEAAAIVKVFNRYSQNDAHRLFVFKWISDGAGEDVGQEWLENHSIPPHIWSQFVEFLILNDCIPRGKMESNGENKNN